MTTVQPGNDHVKYSRVKVIVILPGDKCVLYSRVKEKSYCRVKMENLKFEPKHNLVACLDESLPETDGYRDMIKFIKRTKYVYAICAKPVIYARLIKNFWRTAEVVREENGVTVVRGNITEERVLTVSEDAIRQALRIDEDEVGMMDELTMEECKACFVNMGHPPVFPKSQFYRAKLGKKYKLLCYVIQQCMSRRSAGFDNFPSDIASPIVAIAENKPFNMSRWIMNGFVFNLVKGKRFKFLMYPRKMSIGNVPDVELFDYMRDIVNNEEEVGVVYHHISNGEIVNPVDLVDREIDESDDGEDDGNGDGDNDEEDDGDDDGGDDAESESNSEEAEPIENIEVIEPMAIEEPVEVASGIEEVVAEIPKDVSVKYVRRKRSKPVIVEPEEIDVLQIAQEVVAEAETMAQIVEDADAGATDPITADLPTTSPQVAQIVEQGLESSPNVVSKIEDEKEKRIAELEEMVTKLIEANDSLKASNERKKKRFDEYWDIHNQNLKIFKKLDEDHVKLVDEHVKLRDDHDKLKEEYENLKYDYTDLKAECNTLEAEKEMLEKARGTTNAGILVESPIIIPDEAAAETVNMDKAEGKRKIDAIPEIFGDEESSKKAKFDETVQIEPIQSVAVTETEKVDETKIVSEAETEIVSEAETEIVSDAETEVFIATESEKEVVSEDTVQVEPIQSEAVDVTETEAEVASQFEPVQTDDAPMIEALDDLDDIDWLSLKMKLSQYRILLKSYQMIWINGLHISKK
ncbi:hypothetical protein QVD17_38261 [Tagetes erecta]|uniref:Uncharacterized protein n=1 Tax=Tagetes erecta TaxID=13708 RepID=A0AAD8JZR9_TARER|nr:hypothetical protein QVD17_38261 [Tagetes erecta]